MERPQSNTVSTFPSAKVLNATWPFGVTGLGRPPRPCLNSVVTGVSSTRGVGTKSGNRRRWSSGGQSPIRSSGPMPLNGSSFTGMTW